MNPLDSPVSKQTNSLDNVKGMKTYKQTAKPWKNAQHFSYQRDVNQKYVVEIYLTTVRMIIIKIRYK